MKIYDEMRGWLLDCYDDENDQEIINELTNSELREQIEREFSGGLKEFVRCV